MMSPTVREKVSDLALSSTWLLAAVFAGSIIVTLVFWAALPDRFRLPRSEQSDYNYFYEPVGRNIAAGRGISLGDGGLATFFPPGYPVILAGVFKVSRWLHVSEDALLSGFAVVGMASISSFIFLIGRMLWAPGPALVSSVLWMTYPLALWLTRQPNSEIPFMIVFYGGLFLFWYLLIRKQSGWPLYLLCGIVFGVAMLIRPIAIGVGLVLALVIWIVRREMTARLRLVLIAMLLLGNLVSVLPWEVLVYSRTGKVIPISTSGNGNLASGFIYAIDVRGYRTQTVPPDVTELMIRLRGELDPESLSLQRITSVIATEFWAHPLPMLKLFGLKIMRSWYGTDSGRHETPILLIQLLYLILILWAVQRVWRRGGTNRGFVLGALLMLMYFWGMTVLVVSEVRYVVPVMGVLFTLVGGAFASEHKLTKQDNGPQCKLSAPRFDGTNVPRY